ncbi:collagen alpha-2(VIII) chain-like [Mizuhopecten yessoensis]|uniref:Collagen alpha-2(VIII) chain n=1 Tax=Mizuhopecten yessoensis TaxID=6573 RepID=A0A210PXW4_MIZYE|nr:collagen alpha-2(VIII) chain-like [Mizuhopecten yessoensis]OWF41321.1 Collagen alpha-2(VIII) chain [Mizuhopecten yessoensis]
MAIFAFVLSVVMLVSTGLAAVSPTIDEKLQTAMTEVIVNPEKEYECLLFRLEDKLDRMKEKMAEMERELKKKITPLPNPTQAVNASQYAFSAYLSDKNALHTSGSLKYTKTISNVGGAYNEYTGVFTSAVDGVYVFHFHSSVYAYAKHCVLTLFHENNNVTSTYGYDGNGFASFSNTAVIELKNTEVVHVAVTSPFTKSSCYLRGRFTTFSGFKIA